MRQSKYVSCLASFLLAAAASLLLPSNLALADIHTLEAFLDGLQETPPNASPASGFAQLTLDDVTGDVTITTGNYNGLLGGANAVTINGLAPPGTPAGILISLTLDTPGAATGTFSGGGVLSAPNVLGMLAGNTYVNLRSQVFPSGEIRGQLNVVPEPSTLVIGGLGALGLLLMARRKR